MQEFTFTVDGKLRTATCDPEMPLLYVLRDEMGLKGPKFGCGLAQCGACTVIRDGAAVRSCVLPVGSVQNAVIRTLDGLGTVEHPHPVQAAFIEEQATQCGYCVNGWIMTAVAELERDPNADDTRIRSFLSGLKCRCGAHMSMLRAVKLAAKAMSENKS